MSAINNFFTFSLVAAFVAATILGPIGLHRAHFQMNDNYQSFYQWLRRGGATFNVKIEDTTNGRTIVLDQDAKRGDAVISIPQELCFTDAPITKHPVAGPIVEEELAKIEFIASKGTSLAFALLHEMSRGEKSPWYPYITYLPLTTQSLLDVSASEIGVLTEYHPLYIAWRDMSKHFMDTKKFIFNVLSRMPNNKEFDPDFYTPERIKYAVNMSFNRAFDLTGDAQETVVGFVPLIDMANHSLKAGGTTPVPHVTLKVWEDSPAGTEVFNNYGAGNICYYEFTKQEDKPRDVKEFCVPIPHRSTAQILIPYGYVSTEEESNWVPFPVTIPAEAGVPFNETIVRHTLKKHECFSGQHSLLEVYRGSLSMHFVKCWRILTTLSVTENLPKVVEVGDEYMIADDEVNWDEPIAPLHEVLMWQEITNGIGKTIDTYYKKDVPSDHPAFRPTAHAMAQNLVQVAIKERELYLKAYKEAKEAFTVANEVFEASKKKGDTKEEAKEADAAKSE
eukprot:GFYU01018540.1.p1 GENE.GFYU01018540.1~~GFYU01018540.1.p1  ORF type:complete len:506 (-),score=158.06 GFYU01018540.1:39-1556(-)